MPLHALGLLPVKVGLFCRDTGAKLPCKWGSGTGIYTECIIRAQR